MNGLDVLARLEREALDQEARALRQLDRSLIEIGDRIRDLDQTATAERRAAENLEGGGALLARYLATHRRWRQEALARRAELEQAREAQITRILARRLELERLEILAQRRLMRERADQARREQKAIDELAAIRTHGRR